MPAELQIGGNYVRGLHQHRDSQGRFRAYLAVPEAGSGPGLVLFHDVSDEDQDLRDLGDLYAAEGYVVLCPEAPAVAKGVEDVAETVEALCGAATNAPIELARWASASAASSPVLPRLRPASILPFPITARASIWRSISPRGSAAP
jgi:hypothetical protein